MKKIFDRKKLRVAALWVGVALLVIPAIGVAAAFMSHLLAVAMVLAGSILIGELWNYKFDSYQD